MVIPDSVTEIGNYAFYEVPVTSAQIGTGVSSIGDYAFYNTPMSELVPTRGSNHRRLAFYSSELLSVHFPESLESIGMKRLGLIFLPRLCLITLR